MENVDRAGQEEFIWAMRTRALMTYEEDSRSQSYRESKLEYDAIVHTETRKDNTVYEEQIKALASFVPDEIIADSNDFTPRNLEGAILFIEITGLSDLCEKYNNIAKEETSKLNHILNTYIGTFVQSIMSYNGDVIKFSGHAILSFWKAGLSAKELSLPECIHQALDAALALLKSHGSYETDIGVFLRIKLTISAGNVVFSLIGTDLIASYVLIGLPIWEAKNSMDLLSTGEMLISVAAFDFVNYNEYVFEINEADNYVKIFGVTRNWRSIQRSLGRDVNGDDYNTSLSAGSGESSESVHHYAPNNIYELRPSMGVALENDCFMKNDLRKFIPQTVLKSIDSDDSIDNLTEIRNVSILSFIVEISRIDNLDYIQTIDKCYKCISEIATACDGTMDRLTFREKMFTFLVVFGFRGYKHELDSQRALLCGNKCFVILQKYQFVKTVSVAVTVGMSFCGVIGHTMRRIYSVIGLALNRGDRILSVYTNKICCDKQTFFDSKLEAKNFILLDGKSLKAISYIGPIYEYIHYDSSLVTARMVFNPFPILDRDKEMRTYSRMVNILKWSRKSINLEKRRSIKKQSCLIIKGKPRQGKTRITEEILYSTPSDFPIFRVQLIAADKRLPYRAIRLILAVPMGISEKSSIADREVKICAKLSKMPIPELKCVLNTVFRVNFPKTDMYKNLDAREKDHLLKKTIKQLCHGCFTKLWVIVIDCGEMIDEESWPLIHAMIETYLVVFVITMATNLHPSAKVNNIIKNYRYRILTLKPIDKCFHTAIACQMMNVRGIPAELEMMLHNKSNGNPGWIESYLIYLLQQNKIEIVSMPIEDVEICDLIIPTKEMMSRDVDVMDMRRIEDPSSPAYLDQKWKIFRDCYRDSTSKLKDEIDILTGINQAYAEEFRERIIRYSAAMPTASATDVVHSTSSSSVNGSSISKNTMQRLEINICRVLSEIKVSDVDPEFSQEVRIMKVFDSLTAYEQHILKCSCVIGEWFPREMLIYVMNTIDSRRTALAIKNLFEIGVLGCAAGDFKEYYSNAILNPPHIDPRDERIVVCRCTGRHIPVPCSHLPNYANCGYLRFKMEAFRETTYKILTMEQRKDVHSKAIRFLEKKTKKCESCGGGSLPTLMGVRYDQDLFPKDRSKIKLERNSVAVLENWENLKERKTINKSIYSFDFVRKSSNMQDSFTNVDPTNPFFTTKGYIKSVRHRDSLIRTYSDFDYNDCDCFRILDSMYQQLIIHCEGAEQMDKWLYAVLEYSSLCINNFNTPLALNILFGALEVLEVSGPKVVNSDELWKIPYIEATIYTLIGKARYELGQIEAAKKITINALKTYGYSFPYRSKIQIGVIDIFQRFKLKHIIYAKAGTKANYEAEFCDNVAETLLLICKIYMFLGNWRNAELAALFSLEKAIQSQTNFRLIIGSYTNLLLAAIHRTRMGSTAGLEVKALLFSKSYKGVVESNDLIAIYYLYSSIFKARILRGDLVQSLDIGRVVHRIHKALPYKMIVHDILPLYIQILMLISKFLDAVSIILDLGYCTDDPSALTWYYALCISFHLDTGYVILPEYACQNFLYTTSSYWRKKDTSAEKRLFTAMWLWHLRNENFETALSWKEKVEEFWRYKHSEDNVVNLFSELYYLEGLILNAIYKMDSKFMAAINDVYSEIDEIIKRLEAYSRRFNIIAARLYHLKAWYSLIKNDTRSVNYILKQANKAAATYGNSYDAAWVKHSELAWTRNLSESDRTLWRDHAQINTIDFRELEDTDSKLVYYTLDKPLYQ